MSEKEKEPIAKAIYLYLDYEYALRELNHEERGKLVLAMIDYHKGDEVEELTGYAKMAFSFIRRNMDRDKERYKKIVERNRKIAETRGQE